MTRVSTAIRGCGGSRGEREAARRRLVGLLLWAPHQQLEIRGRPIAVGTKHYPIVDDSEYGRGRCDAQLVTYQWIAPVDWEAWSRKLTKII